MQTTARQRSRSTDCNRRSRTSWVLAWVVTSGIVAAAGLLAGAARVPPRGAQAPPIDLKYIGGTPVRTKDPLHRTLVVIFGELSHEAVRRACADTLDVLAETSGDAAIAILIATEGVPSDGIKETAVQGRFPTLILHDSMHEAFNAFHVLVEPTVVVIDGTGKVVHSMPGFLPRFKQLLSQAIRLSNGDESQEAFDRFVEQQGPVERAETRRALELVKLADEFARHKLVDLARLRYEEALAAEPACVQALVGIGELELSIGNYAAGQTRFRAALSTDPTSADAKLGLAMVLVSMGGPRLAEAESLARDVLQTNGKNVRGHYVLGHVNEANGRREAAMHEYRRAAELAMVRHVALAGSGVQLP
ncbi:MAG: redoxin domain-containing protein [Planctomycetota bacterium]|nr:redoxin domain-containing protein [Planctomycetota bacterium]